MSLDPNRRGQAYALTVMTAIRPGEEEPLRGYLEALHPSPFARLERTHFARFVIVPELFAEASQRRPDALARALLIFSASFDGPRDSYVDELCSLLAGEAAEIWGRCEGAGDARGPALERYLLRNQVRTGFFVAAYPGATVPEVRRCLGVRERMIAFAARAQALAPAELRRGFLDAFG